MQQQSGLLCGLYHPQCCLCKALPIPKTSIYIEKSPFYNGTLDSGTPGDSEIAFLHWGDVLGCSEHKGLFADSQELGIFCMALSQCATVASTVCNINVAACMQRAGI